MSKETPYLFNICGWLKLLYYFYLCSIQSKSFLRDLMIKNNSFLDNEMTFLSIEDKMSIFTSLKNFGQVSLHSSKESPNMEKSSMNTSKYYSTISMKMVIMHLWNVVGALHKLNDIILNGKVP